MRTGPESFTPHPQIDKLGRPDRPIGRVLATEPWSVPAILVHEDTNMIVALNLAFENSPTGREIMAADAGDTPQKRRVMLKWLMESFSLSRMAIQHEYGPQIDNGTFFNGPIIKKLLGATSVYFAKIVSDHRDALRSGASTPQQHHYDIAIASSEVFFQHHQLIYILYKLKDKPVDKEVVAIFEYWLGKTAEASRFVGIQTLARLFGKEFCYLEILNLDPETRKKLYRLYEIITDTFLEKGGHPRALSIIANKLPSGRATPEDLTFLKTVLPPEILKEVRALLTL